MADQLYNQLSRRERQIMNAVFALGEATVNQVALAIASPPTVMAVRRMMHILEEKGHLKHVQRGREFVYQPTQPRLRAGRSAFQRVIQTFFEGSLEKAVAAHLADSAASLSTDELKRLADLIHQARNKGK